MENAHSNSISNELFNTLLLSAAATTICVICYFTVPLNTQAIWKFILGYLGYASFALIPMTILVLSIFIHALIIPLPMDSIWAKIANRFQKDFQYVGLLGTFLAIGLSLNNLDASHMTTDSIFQIAKEIGTAIWSSIVGVAGSMLANFIYEELTVHTQTDDTEFTLFSNRYFGIIGTYEPVAHYASVDDLYQSFNHCIPFTTINTVGSRW